MRFMVRLESIEAGGLHRPRFLAYPHGESNASTRRLLKRRVWRRHLPLCLIAPDRSCNPYLVPRIEVLRGDVGSRFRLRDQNGRSANGGRRECSLWCMGCATH